MGLNFSRMTRSRDYTVILSFLPLPGAQGARPCPTTSPRDSCVCPGGLPVAHRAPPTRQCKQQQSLALPGISHPPRASWPGKPVTPAGLSLPALLLDRPLPARNAPKTEAGPAAARSPSRRGYPRRSPSTSPSLPPTSNTRSQPWQCNRASW